MHCFQKFDKAAIILVGLNQPGFKQLRGARNSIGHGGFQGGSPPNDRGVLPQVGDRRQKIKPLLKALNFKLPFGIFVFHTFAEKLSFVAIVGRIAKDHLIVRGIEELALFVVFLVVVKVIILVVIEVFHIVEIVEQFTQRAVEDQRWSLPIFLGVGLQEIEEPRHFGPAIDARFFLHFFDRGKPTERQPPKRAFPFFKRRTVLLADPLHHQRHRSHGIAVIEQGFDHQFKRLGIVELIDKHPPEADVARGGPCFVPGIEGPCHEVSRNFDFLGNEAIDPFDGVRGELIPPKGEPREHGGEYFFHLRVVHRGGFTPRPSAQVKHLLDKFDQFVDPPIVDAVFECREQRKIAGEADDVPRIDQRAAFDRAVSQVFDFLQVLHDAGHIATVDGIVPRGEPTIDFAQHARCGDTHGIGLALGRFGIAQSSVQIGQMNPLHLQRASPGKLMIQMLPCRAKRLSIALRFFQQPPPMISFDLME